MKIWLLALALAQGADDAMLAPTVETLDQSMNRIDRLLEAAREATARLARAQNAWVDARCMADRCHYDVGAKLIVEARAAGHDARNLVQGARAELTRAQRIATFAAVAPLSGPKRADRMRAIEADVGAAKRAWLIRTAWYARYMQPWSEWYRRRVSQTCLAKPEAEP